MVQEFFFSAVNKVFVLFTKRFKNDHFFPKMDFTGDPFSPGHLIIDCLIYLFNRPIVRTVYDNKYKMSTFCVCLDIYSFLNM